jgi:hypothetical protein
MARSQLTLLQQEMMQRRLTREDTIKALVKRAKHIGVDDFTLSLRQLDRWLAGDLTTMPRPSMCRVIEAEFGATVDRLFQRVDVDAAGVRIVEAEPLDVHAMVSAAATSSARFGQWADSLAIGELAFATLWLRLGQLAVDYVHAPMVPVFRDLESLRNDIFALLAAPDPVQVSQLYMLAGATCGLLAHASGNLGNHGAAQIQACTALICARKAENPTLAAWVLGVRALQSEWSGNPSHSLDFVSQARQEAAREDVHSTVPVWLAAVEARAYARLKDHTNTVHALRLVAQLRDSVTNQLGKPNALDQIGGILTFSEAKQHYYVGTTYRRIGDYPAAATHSTAAIAAYAQGPVEQRSYGDEIIAWADLAIARASGETADLDGAAEALRSIELQPESRWLPTLLGPLRDLDAALSTPKVRMAPRAVSMRRSVAAMIASCQRPPAEVQA